MAFSPRPTSWIDGGRVNYGPGGGHKLPGSYAPRPSAKCHVEGRGVKASGKFRGLLVTQRFHRLEVGGALGRVETEKEPYGGREQRRHQDGVQADGRRQIGIRGAGDGASDADL